MFDIFVKIIERIIVFIKQYTKESTEPEIRKKIP